MFARLAVGWAGTAIGDLIDSKRFAIFSPR